MTAPRLATLALLLAIAGCSNALTISPNDPQYARSGAPRAGEAEPSPGAVYGQLGHDGQGSP
jgi:hypothetical protein